MFFASLFLIFKEERTFHSSNFLGAAILTKSIIQTLFILVMVFNHEPLLKMILKITTPLYFLMPALAFFYFRNTLSNSKEKRAHDWMHYLPFYIVSALCIFEYFGYTNPFTFNETNISFNEFFILQTVSNKFIAAIHPLYLLIYLIYIFFRYEINYAFLNFKALQSNTQLLIAFWFVLFGTQIAKIGKLIYGEFILNSVGDILFYMINLFVIFQLYKLFLTLYLMGNSLLAFRNYGKNEREN